MKRYILLSLLLHAVLLLAWQQQQAPRQDDIALRTLSLQLQALPAPRPAASPPAPDPGSRSAQPAAHRPLPVHSHAREPVGKDIPEPVADKVVAGQPASNESPAHDELASRVHAALHAALQAKFSYPRRARLRGWEGTVVISLRILPDGAVTDVQVAGSSGIDILDAAACHTISDLRVPEAIAWLNGQSRALRIPVEYRLTDS